MNYTVLPGERLISGVVHRCIEREDGFRFFLDPAFMHLLFTLNGDQRIEGCCEYDATSEEKELMIRILNDADLIQVKVCH